MPNRQTSQRTYSSGEHFETVMRCRFIELDRLIKGRGERVAVIVTKHVTSREAYESRRRRTRQMISLSQTSSSMSLLTRSACSFTTIRTGPRNFSNSASCRRSTFSHSDQIFRKPLPAYYIRGGTSKGIFVRRDDLPEDQAQWTEVIQHHFTSISCDLTEKLVQIDILRHHGFA